MHIRVATRKSQLALVQSDLACNAIRTAVPDATFEIVEVVSDGCYEKFQGDLSQAGGKGLFVKKLEQTLIDGDADIAVHSMKDVPTDEEMLAGLTVPCALERADRRDVVVCRPGDSVVALPDGARIGTSSPRRVAQIQAIFPHLVVTPIRGNVDTRLKKLQDGDVDAVMLAKAGLDRLGLTSCISDVLEPDIMCPSAGQGIIGVMCREQDSALKDVLQKVRHESTYVSLLAEREMLKTLGANCLSAVGGYCEVTKSGENLRMIAMAASPDGKRVVWSRQKMVYGQHLEIGKAVAEDLLTQGAADLLHVKAA